MPFDGFTDQDFAVFDLPGFEARMPQLRARITPRLKELGAQLTPHVTEIAGETMYPHTALHMRRTVNAPEETWVAFARSARAYKPFLHYRVAISAEQIRVMLFMEDYAEEKSTFAANLARRADALAGYLAAHPGIGLYETRGADGEPLRGTAVTGDVLREFGARLQRVKGQHAAFGIRFDRGEPALGEPQRCLETIMAAMRDLRPLYDCGHLD